MCQELFASATISGFHDPFPSIGESLMPWKRMLAYVAGEVEESLLLRIEYLDEAFSGHLSKCASTSQEHRQKFRGITFCADIR